MKLQQTEYLTLFTFLFSVLLIFYLSFFSYSQFLSSSNSDIAVELFNDGERQYEVTNESKDGFRDGQRLYFKKVKVKIVVRKGKEELWSGEVVKGTSVQEIVSKLNIDISKVFERDRERVLTKNGSVVHIRA